MNEVLYMGCWDQPGHYLRDANRRHRDHPLMPRLDGAFVPNKARSGQEGVIRYAQMVEDGKLYTVIGFRDNSVDHRPGSHATFVVDDAHSFDDIVALARAQFGWVFDRIEKRGIILRREETET